MKTKQFLDLLRIHPNKKLSYEYARDQRVRNDFHITEVKNIAIDSVDCGGRTDQWKETVIQIWENPVRTEPDHRLSTTKALGIINRVHKLKPIDLDTEVKFEYGNSGFHTAQLTVHNYDVTESEMIFYLHPESTQCKASELCGTAAVSEEREVSSECAPGSGCC